ncbi:replication factor-a protein [Auriculariales sp. MPI-PUGE-AT-0066]|nr:replication factor-a protein [Auriculariales sp. MPI-PUGE-AT-0066]
MDQLTQDIVLRMADPATTNDDPLWKSDPVVQVVMLKEIQSNKTNQSQERKRGAVSDGKHYVQVMFTTQLKDIMEQEQLQRNCIIRIKHMTCNVMQEKRLIVIMELDIIGQHSEKIGNPVSVDTIFSGGGGGGGSNNEQANPAPAPSAATTSKPSVSKLPVQRPAETTTSRVASTSRAVAPSGTNAFNENTPIFQIEALSPYQNRWTIKARGKLFSCVFMDNSGAIRATGFTDAVAEYYEKLKENHVYYITKARIQVAKKKFSNLPNEYEMTIDKGTIIEEAVDDDDSVPMQTFQFKALSELNAINNDAIIDVLGIVTDPGESTTITTKSTNKQLSKRDIIIADMSLSKSRLTLWGKQAETFNGSANPVIAFKGVKVAEYNGGKSLSLLSSGSMTINPDMDEAHALRGWYDHEGEKTVFKNQTASGGGGGGGGIKRDELMPLRTAREMDYDNGTGHFFAIRALVVHIRNEGNLWYRACKTCSKKVPDGGNECAQGHTGEPNLRYNFNVAVADNSAQGWFTVFNETGHAITGQTADELAAKKESMNPEEFDIMLKKIPGQYFMMNCKGKQDTYNEQTRTKYSIMNIQPVNYLEEGLKIAQEISSLDGSYHH